MDIKIRQIPILVSFSFVMKKTVNKYNAKEH